MRNYLKTLPFLAILICLFASPAASEHKRTLMRGDYYRLDDRYAAYDKLAADHAGLVSVGEFGRSSKGKPLIVIKISAKSSKNRPEALITANIHAVEAMGGRMAYETAKRLAEGYGADPWITELLNSMDFYVAPMLNPDGYNDAYRHLSRGFTARRDNDNYVDLNRNFPYPKGVKRKGMRAGSKFKRHPNYRGPYPLSEPETKALTELFRAHRFFVAVNFHTTGGHFIYPHAYTPDPPPDEEIYLAMGKALNDNQKVKKPYLVHQAYDWYQTLGSLNDWAYRGFGAMSVTIEIARPDRRLANPLRALNPFWWYNPVDVSGWVENDRDASLRAISVAFKMTGGRPREPLPTDWVMGK